MSESTGGLTGFGTSCNSFLADFFFVFLVPLSNIFPSAVGEINGCLSGLKISKLKSLKPLFVY